MSDLISRQAAIDALEQAKEQYFDRRVIIGKMQNVVSNLPSTQPEEDCDTCKYGYFGDDKCNNCRVRYPSHYERRTDEQTD